MVVNVGKSPETDQRPPQSLFKTVGAATLLAIVINVSGAIWWTSSANSRLTAVEQFVQESKTFPERLVRVETTIGVVDKRTERIEDKMDRILDRTTLR